MASESRGVAAFLRRSMLLSFCLSSWVVARAHGQIDWAQRADSPDHLEPGGAGVAYDPTRGRTMLFQHGETWAWDGASWALLDSALTSVPMTERLLSYDSRRDRLILIGFDYYPTASSLWEWDGSTWAQAVAAFDPPARGGGAIAYDESRGVTVLFGGQAYGSGQFLNDTWEWDGTSWIPRYPATSPSGRRGHVMTYDSSRGRVVLLGGGAFGYLTDQWEWDGQNWAQIPTTPPIATTSSWFAAAFDAARTRLVLSVYGSNAMQETWEWDGLAWTQRFSTTTTPSRCWHRMAYDSRRDRITLIGGSTRFDTWEWNGADWTEVVPAQPAPSSYTSNRSLVFDPQRGRVVLAESSGTTWQWEGRLWTRLDSERNGWGSIAFSLAWDSARSRIVLVGAAPRYGSLETWEWDGYAWTSLPLMPRPPGRTRHDIVYDSTRNVVLLFGGAPRGGPLLDDLWSWNGTSWTALSPQTSPAARFGHAMAYDSARDRTVLFGGTEVNALADTWEWDGAGWTHIFPATSPPARYGHSMTFDPATGRTILFGGRSDTQALSDTWEWDGATWTPLPTPRTPSPQAWHSLAHDPVRRRTILFGGMGDDSVPIDETWEFGLVLRVDNVRPNTGSERGDDVIGIDGLNLSSVTRVTIGGQPATVIGATSNRLVARTPAGLGTADVVVSNDADSLLQAGGFTYDNPALAARYGNVNVALGDREDVLLANAYRGDPLRREVPVETGRPILIAMANPSNRSATSRFALYARVGEPDAGMLTLLPRGLGSMIFPPPFHGGHPVAIWNNAGYREILGTPTLPSSPAPSLVFTRPGGAMRPIAVALQGLIQDDGSQIPEGWSVTNAVILRIE